MKTPTILFSENDSTKKEILSLLGKSVDDEGFIVNSDNLRVLSVDAQEIELRDLGAIRKGSELFYKSDVASLIKLSESIGD